MVVFETLVNEKIGIFLYPVADLAQTWFAILGVPFLAGPTTGRIFVDLVPGLPP